jgi:hypothetical protein
VRERGGGLRPGHAVAVRREGRPGALASRPSLALIVALALSACTAAQGGGEAASKRSPTSRATTPPADTAADPAPTSTTAPATDSRAAGPRPAPARPATASGQYQPVSSTTTGAPSRSATAPPPPGLPPDHCPAPRTCRRYRFNGDAPARWATKDGRATIPYWINPTACTLPAPDVQKAIEDATVPWERAVPAVDFAFAGFTDRPPVPGDGYNVVGCTNASSGHALVQGAGDGTIVEADMPLAAGSGWVYAPCEQRDGACSPAYLPNPNDPNGGCCGVAMNNVAVHEFGHWLWLTDMDDQTLDHDLTLHPSSPDQSTNTSRSRMTLALGDVLGVRALYPCSCPLPPIYDP